MFLVSHSLEVRAREIRSWLPKQPSVALVVAAVYFEWTVCRAIIGLSRRPNKEVRQTLGGCYGICAYKNLWREELGHLPDAHRLPQVVNDWHLLTPAIFSSMDETVTHRTWRRRRSNHSSREFQTFVRTA